VHHVRTSDFRLLFFVNFIVGFSQATRAAAETAAAAASRLLDLLRRTLHTGETDEHLFECRLTDRVVFDVEVIFGALDFAEYVRPRKMLRALKKTIFLLPKSDSTVKFSMWLVSPLIRLN
jgi:hypothetical protein